MDESSIMKKLKEDDESVVADLEEMYKKYISTIIWQIIRGCMTEEDLQETVNDVLFRFWQYRDSINLEKGTIKSYLASVARSQAKNKLREIRPRFTLVQDKDMIDLNTPLHKFEKNELREGIWKALKIFDEIEREIFIRYYYFYETTVSISKRLGMKESTIKSRLRRGRKKLKKQLEIIGFAG